MTKKDKKEYLEQLVANQGNQAGISIAPLLSAIIADCEDVFTVTVEDNQENSVDKIFLRFLKCLRYMYWKKYNLLLKVELLYIHVIVPDIAYLLVLFVKAKNRFEKVFSSQEK